LERILESLSDLNTRMDRMRRREAKARADSEARVQRRLREAAYRDRIARQARFARFQAKVDSILETYGVRAPGPIAEESARSYKIRLLQLLQDQLPPEHELSRVPLRRCDDATVDAFSPQIQAAVMALAYDARSVPKGELRVRHEVDAHTGQRITHFIGGDEASFVRQFTRPARKVSKIIARKQNGQDEILYQLGTGRLQ
jgi:hypothetical protein